MWGSADQGDLHQTWASELAGFQGEDFREALEVMRTNYREYPPTLFQFAALCRDAKAKREAKVKRLLPPRTAMPAHVREQLQAFLKSHTRH